MSLSTLPGFHFCARVQGRDLEKVGTGSLCANNFCKFRAVDGFVLAAKLMFQNGIQQG